MINITLIDLKCQYYNHFVSANYVFWNLKILNGLMLSKTQWRNIEQWFLQIAVAQRSIAWFASLIEPILFLLKLKYFTESLSSTLPLNLFFFFGGDFQEASSCFAY